MDVLAGLDDGQRSAVLAPSGPVCVLAGAGTGKTRTITHRIAHLIGSGAHSLVRGAGGDVHHQGRRRDAGPVAVPGGAWRPGQNLPLRGPQTARYFWPRSVGGALWPVLEHKLRLVAIAARRANAGTDAATLRDLASEIEWSKATLAGPADYLAAVAKHQRDTPLPAETVAKVFAVYESVKQEAEQLDFDDLLLHTCAVLEDDEAVAREFRARYRCFVVDEYQDVTPLQQRTLDAWLGGRDQLTVVGDANQTIYSFAGASPGYLLGFERKYPNAAVVRLERDYRSTPQVVTLANRIIAGAGGVASKYRLKLTAALPDGPPTTFDEHPDEPTEARAVAAAAAELIQGGLPASGIAVLYRINAQSEVYEAALSGRGVPYVVRGGERFFARAEVRQALGLIRTTAQRFAADGRAPDELDDGSGGNRVRPAGPHPACAAVHDRPVRRAATARRAAGQVGLADRDRSRWRRISPMPIRPPRSAPWPPNWTSAPRRSTPRLWRVSRWPPCTRPRGWSGTRSSWSA